MFKKNKYYLLLIIMCLFFSFKIQASDRDTLTVMTYNIWNGFDWGKDLERKEKVINWIKSKNTNVVALQELNAYTPEKLAIDAKKWGHDYSILLKTTGYSVGITSKKPIILKERVLDEMWHGMLYCETYGINFFVVHLSPADYESRIKETKIISKKMAAVIDEDYIVLGDFNALSPLDHTYLSNNDLLLDKFQKRDKKPTNKYKNLLNDYYDYTVISAFLGLPTIDVSNLFVAPDKKYSFPTPALIKKGRTENEIIQFRERIDYILVSPKLAKKCIDAVIYNDQSTHYLSDHFPVVAKFIYTN